MPRSTVFCAGEDFGDTTFKLLNALSCRRFDSANAIARMHVVTQCTLDAALALTNCR